MLLTGTPLQNSVEELFSLLNFLEPQQFPSETAFLEEFGDLKTEEQVPRRVRLVTSHRSLALLVTRQACTRMYFVEVNKTPHCLKVCPSQGAVLHAGPGLSQKQSSDRAHGPVLLWREETGLCQGQALLPVCLHTAPCMPEQLSTPSFPTWSVPKARG